MRPTKPEGYHQHFLIFFAGIAGVVLAVASPFCFYVDIPFYDDWILIPIADHMADGKFPISDLWALHNEHRLLIAKILLPAWGMLTRWDMRAVPWLSLALLVLASLSVYRLWKKGPIPWTKAFADPRFWIVLIFSLSLKTVHSILWCLMLSVFLCVVFTIWAVKKIASGPGSLRSWIQGYILMVLATYSFAGGLVSWLAAAPLLWHARRQKVFGRVLTAGFLFMATSFVLYFWGYHNPAQHESRMPFASVPLSFLVYFFTYLGSIFHNNLFSVYVTAFMGCLGFFSAMHVIVNAVKDKDPSNTSSQALAGILIFVLANAFLTATGSVGVGGMRAALVARYIPISCFLWAILALRFFEGNRWERALFSVMVVLAVLASILNSLPLEGWKEDLMHQKEHLEETHDDGHAMRDFYVDGDLVDRGCAILNERRWSVFRGEPGSKVRID